MIRYANTPIDKRLVVLNFAESGMMTLKDIYDQVTGLEDRIRPAKSQQQHLMDMAEKHL